MENPIERPMRFVYARYQMAGSPAAEVARNLPVILATLASARQTAGKYLWAIGEIGELTVGGETLWFGSLGKTARAASETKGDDPAPAFDRQRLAGKKAACSNFFICPSQSLLVLEDKPLLPAAKFLKRFKQLWEKSQPTEIDFAFLQSEPEIFAILNRWDKITAAKFDLAAAQARPREDFAPLDQLLKRSQATRAAFKFEGGSHGLATDNSVIQQAVSLAAAGYGEFSFRGVAEDAKAGLNSQSCLMASELVGVDDLEALAPVVLAGLRKILMLINSPGSNSPGGAGLNG